MSDQAFQQFEGRRVILRPHLVKDTQLWYESGKGVMRHYRVLHEWEKKEQCFLGCWGQEKLSQTCCSWPVAGLKPQKGALRHRTAPWREPVPATASCRIHPLPTPPIQLSCMYLSRRLTSLEASSNAWPFSYIGFCWSLRPFSSAGHHWEG